MTVRLYLFYKGQNFNREKDDKVMQHALFLSEIIVIKEMCKKNKCQ